MLESPSPQMEAVSRHWFLTFAETWNSFTWDKISKEKPIKEKYVYYYGSISIAYISHKYKLTRSGQYEHVSLNHNAYASSSKKGLSIIIWNLSVELLLTILPKLFWPLSMDVHIILAMVK